MVTIDASVWLSALSPREHNHSQSAEFIVALIRANVRIHQPGLFIVEVCATIARRTGDRALALATGRAALATPGLVDRKSVV